MSSQPRPDGGSPLDKLTKDASQYRQAQIAGRLQQRRVPVQAAPRPAPPAEERSWTELDSALSSQIVVGLLLLAYSLVMVAASFAVILLSPGSSMVLWVVTAFAVIVAMIAHHKGRPPLLWFMYGSLLPMGPAVHGAIVGKIGGTVAAASAGSGQDLLGLGAMQGLVSAGQAASGSAMDLLVFVGLLGAIPLVHVLLISQDLQALESRQLAMGLKKCPHCAEMVKQEAKVCRWCGKEQMTR